MQNDSQNAIARLRSLGLLDFRIVLDGVKPSPLFVWDFLDIARMQRFDAENTLRTLKNEGAANCGLFRFKALPLLNETAPSAPSFENSPVSDCARVSCLEFYLNE